MSSWRDVLKIHAACELFPLMPPDEMKALGEDIKTNGLQQRITLWPVDEPPGYVLLDGRNRLDAMEAVGLKLVDNPNATTVEEIFAGDNIRATLIAPIPAKEIDPVAYVISANIRRRHLTCEQKRTLIAELLRADPNRSNLWTAKLVGVDDKTVGSVRRDLEARSEIPNVAKTTDTKGRQQPIRKPRPTAAHRAVASVEKISTSAASKPSASPKVNLAPPLNSLSWSDATPELRVKFIDNIGVRDLWHSMSFEQRSALTRLINTEQVARNTARAAS
jgi:ParB-like chromosome segregation protein Spo0J